MRSALTLIAIAALALAAAPRVQAQPAGAPKGDPSSGPGASPAPDSPETELARRHFGNGVKLYSDGNFSGALAEFEAAYRLKPGPASLKNVALSQKALFRYSEAADTLEQVLARHGAELSDADKQVIRTAIDELSSLVGSVLIRVTPADAKITVDGRPANPGKPLRLNVGEHTVVAEAPGHSRESRVFRVAGGQKDLLVDIALATVGGLVTIKAQDPEAAIAVDGVPKGLGAWSGWLAPGPHAVQVYRAGYEQFQTRLVVEVGKRHEVVADPLEKSEDDAPLPGGGTKQVRGWYGLLAISGLSLRNDPAELDIDNAQVGGGSFGVRAGYRVWTPIAVELLLEGGRHEITGACDKRAEDTSGGTLKCGSEAAVQRTLQLESLRLGPNLRLMSSGESVRFTSTLGVGAVRHLLTMDAPSAEDASLGAPPGGEAKGWDPYFLLEVGAQLNAGHILLELNGLVFIDGASNVRGQRDDDSDWRPFADTGGLLMGGIGLRGGWSEWRPSPKR